MKCTPNSPNFVRWLSEMTALPALLAGPGLDGGGLHQANRGGFLNVHTDFSHHHYHENWRWRLKPGLLTADIAVKLALLAEVSDRLPTPVTVPSEEEFAA